MSMFDGLGDDLDLELDDLELSDGLDPDTLDLGAPGDPLYLPDPFADGPIPTQATPLESATAFYDNVMNADPEQLQRMAGFEQGVAYEQDIKNDLADRELEVQQAEEASAAVAESEMLAWQADRAADAAAQAVADSERERGV